MFVMFINIRGLDLISDLQERNHKSSDALHLLASDWAAVSPAQGSAAASKAEVSPEVLLKDKTNNFWH